MKKIFLILNIFLVAALLCSFAPLFSVASNSYWGYDSYDVITHPNAPAEITSYPTTVKKVSNSVYTMSCDMAGIGTLSISLIEESWGTFNLGNWILVDKNNTSHKFVDDSTDTEYVHRYYHSNGKTVPAGGNHGGEALEEIKLYDGESGEEILLAVGQSTTVNVLHVIQKTCLIAFPDANGDSINDYNNKNIDYEESDVFARLTRKYTFTGPQIKLNVDYLYTRDVYHGRNMACMFPVNKKYSDYCDMIDKNGNVIKTIESRPYGDTSIADYAGPENSGYEAVRVVVYSKDYPNYQFDIRVNTVKDSLNNFENGSYKTAYWDMNRYANKVYFSRYDHSKSVLHEKNTQLHTEAVWMFNYTDTPREPNSGEGDIDLTDNVAYKKPYATSGEYRAGSNGYDPTKDPKYPDEGGITLTDGKLPVSKSYLDAAWAGLHNSTPAALEKGYSWVTIDLQGTYTLNKIVAYLAPSLGGGVSYPNRVVAVGYDNKGNEFEIGQISVPSQISDTDAYLPFELSLNGVVADKIEIRMYRTAASTFISEVAAYGVAGGSYPTTDPNPDPDPDPEPKYSVGDINGNGKIDARDYLLLKRAYFGTYELTCDDAIADINGNGKIDARDYLLLKRAYFGTYEIK